MNLAKLIADAATNQHGGGMHDPADLRKEGFQFVAESDNRELFEATEKVAVVAKSLAEKGLRLSVKSCAHSSEICVFSANREVTSDVTLPKILADDDELQTEAPESPRKRPLNEYPQG